MEDILSSIKRIIAEEGDAPAQGARGRKSIRPAHAVRDVEPDDDGDEVLELNDAVSPALTPPRVERQRPEIERPRAEAERPRPETERPRMEAERPCTNEAEAEPILSSRAAEASRGSLDQLSRLVVKPGTATGDSLEGLVRDMLRPMLRDWLDAKLPGMVEEMVSREIARITRRD